MYTLSKAFLKDHAPGQIVLYFLIVIIYVPGAQYKKNGCTQQHHAPRAPFISDDTGS